jgi:DNA integrity scanning protein DisA with diadenylate cyclase activity
MGALIVIPGRESIERHTEGGIEIDARLSEPLLLSLFDPNSPGHDGAVVIQGSRISAFAVHLPLSTVPAGRGTRHAAALGLAERCDALCVVVSEERGTISLAREGAIRPIANEAQLAGDLPQLSLRMLPERLATPRSGGAGRRASPRWAWRQLCGCWSSPELAEWRCSEKSLSR